MVPVPVPVLYIAGAWKPSTCGTFKGFCVKPCKHMSAAASTISGVEPKLKGNQELETSEARKMLMAIASALLTVGFTVKPPLRCVPHARALSTRMQAGPVEVTEKWVTTASGLKYLDVTVGDGQSLNKGDVVKVEYTGWVESSGKQFDSSVGRAPIAFAIGTGRVIPGWDEGVMGMKVGGQRKLSIPSKLGYGEMGVGAIPPNADLQFDCKLVAVETGAAGLIATFPGGVTNLILATILALSFIPYFLPKEMVPDFWK